MMKHLTTLVPRWRLQNLPKVHRGPLTKRMKIETGFVTPAVVERPTITAASTSVSSSALSFFISLQAFSALPLQTKARQPLLSLRGRVKLEIEFHFCRDLSHSTCPKVLCSVRLNFLTDSPVFLHPL